METNKKVVVKVTFSGPGSYTGFYDMGRNLTIGCQNETKFWEREVQDDTKWPPIFFVIGVTWLVPDPF